MLTPLSTDLQLPLSIDEGDNIAIPQGKLANTEMDDGRNTDPFRTLLKRGMGNGEWGMGNGEWEMENGKLKMGN